MRKMLIVSALSLATVSAAAQNPVVKPVENTLQEVMQMLDLMGVNGYRFDLSAYSDGEYEFSTFVDEYVDGKKLEQNQTITSARNWAESWTQEDFDSPQEYEKWRDGKRFSADGKKYLECEALGVFIAPLSDSTRRVKFEFYGAGAIANLLKLRELDSGGAIKRYDRYFYGCRPFKLLPNRSEGRIPLLFYSSFWWDEEYQIIRSCMATEIEPDLSNEQIKLIPHFFVLGIEVKKVQ